MKNFKCHTLQILVTRTYIFLQWEFANHRPCTYNCKIFYHALWFSESLKKCHLKFTGRTKLEPGQFKNDSIQQKRPALKCPAFFHSTQKNSLISKLAIFFTQFVLFLIVTFGGSNIQNSRASSNGFNFTQNSKFCFMILWALRKWKFTWRRNKA